MKIRLILALTALGACSSPMLPESAGPLLVTDASEYQLAEYQLTSPPTVEVRIGYTFSNRTGKTVSLLNCLGQVPPTLERRVGDEWVLAWQTATFACSSPPIVIDPETQYSNELHVFAFPSGSNFHPQFTPEPISGTYRLVWHVTVWDYEDTGPGRSTKLPERLRVSNSFQLLVP